MSWQSVAESAIRGTVAGVRGALEAKVLALEAKDARAQKEAEFALERRRLSIAEQKNILDDAFRQKELGEEGRQADEAEKTKRYQIFEDKQGLMYKVDTETNSAEQIAIVGKEEALGVADKRADATKYVADKNLEGTQSTNQAKERVAAADRELKENIAAEANETTLKVEELRSNTALKEAEVKKQIAAEGNASAEKIAQWTLANEAYQAELKASGDDAAARGTVLEGLTPAQTDRVDKLATAYKGETYYQDLQQLQSEYTRVVETYGLISEDAKERGVQLETGQGDIALINLFQRFIDPGVSVREGDVTLQQQAESLAQRIGLTGKARKLTDRQRKEMFQIVTAFYKAAMVRKSKDLTLRYRDRIEIDAELKGTGLEVKHLGTDFYEQYGRTLDPLANEDEASTDGDPDTPMPGVGKQNTTLGAIKGEGQTNDPAAVNRDRNIETAARRARDNNWTDEQFREELVKSMEKAGVPIDEDFIDRAIELRKAMKPLPEEEPTEETPVEPNQETEPQGNQKEQDELRALDFTYSTIGIPELRQKMTQDGIDEETIEKYITWRKTTGKERVKKEGLDEKIDKVDEGIDKKKEQIDRRW